MSRLEDLLQTLCPDGVEYTQLGKVAEIRSGWGFPLSEQGKSDGEFPFFKVSDMNTPGNEMMMRVANNYIEISTSNNLGCNPAPSGTVIFPKIGAAIGTNKKRILNKLSCYDNNVVGIVPSDKLLSKYFFYLIESVDLLRFANYSGAMPSIRKTTLEKFSIPLPPLPVQEEIVRILDTFSGVVAELEQKLEAEQAARVRQYEHYRNELLSFDSNSRIMEKLLTDYSLNGVEFKNLGEICNVTTGKLNANAMKDDGKYPFFTCAREVYRIDNYAFNTEALLVSGNGSQVGHIHYYNGKFNAYQRTYVLDKFTENISYIRHVLRAFLKQRILEEVNVSGVPYIKLDTLTDFLIPIPPREIQDQIVSILDRFDTLVNDLKSGLPAEIILRRKQYEYYRNKLLTFKPLE